MTFFFIRKHIIKPYADSIKITCGTIASRDYSPDQILIRGLWVLLHLLQFCISNQAGALEEDMKNKPWRPLSSGRISLQAALRIRWILFIACISFSASRGVLVAGTVLLAATIAHNELALGRHWFIRNGLNAIGYTAFSLGAAGSIHAGGWEWIRVYFNQSYACITRGGLIRSLDDDFASRSAKRNAHLFIGVIIFTTIQAQDFKDVEGDALVGRKTLPLAYPMMSRIITSSLVPFWSAVAVCIYHKSNIIPISGILLLGAWTSVRFWIHRTKGADTKSYILYNVGHYTILPCTVLGVNFHVEDLAHIPAYHSIFSNCFQARGRMVVKVSTGKYSLYVCLIWILCNQEHIPHKL